VTGGFESLDIPFESRRLCRIVNEKHTGERRKVFCRRRRLCFFLSPSQSQKRGNVTLSADGKSHAGVTNVQRIGVDSLTCSCDLVIMTGT